MEPDFRYFGRAKKRKTLHLSLCNLFALELQRALATHAKLYPVMNIYRSSVIVLKQVLKYCSGTSQQCIRGEDGEGVCWLDSQDSQEFEL